MSDPDILMPKQSCHFKLRRHAKNKMPNKIILVEILHKVLKTSLRRRLQAQTLPNATTPIGKILFFTKMAAPGFARSAKEPNLAYCWFSEAYVFLPIHTWTNKYL